MVPLAFSTAIGAIVALGLIVAFSPLNAGAQGLVIVLSVAICAGVGKWLQR